MTGRFTLVTATRVGLVCSSLLPSCLSTRLLPQQPWTMSDPPPGDHSKKSRLVRPFKGLFSSRLPSPAPPYQGAQSDNATASISASPDSATSAPQANQQRTEYTAILELSTDPPSLTWERRMKERGSTAYEGLKMALQGIYDFSESFPLLKTTAGLLLTISKVVDVRRSVPYV